MQARENFTATVPLVERDRDAKGHGLCEGAEAGLQRDLQQAVTNPTAFQLGGHDDEHGHILASLGASWRRALPIGPAPVSRTPRGASWPATPACQ
jgi:hypothetical protein